MELRRLIGNRYLIENISLDRIGRGGAGNVYRAQDTFSHTRVAVKHLKPELIAGDSSIVARFEREGEALRRLNHPNIVTMLGTITEGEEHYLVMEYVPGGSLADLLHEQGHLPVEQVLRIALELADALTRAHHLNIIHRDLKPANVLIAADGTPRLTDFGVAHLGDMVSITQTGTVTGTYAYLSPEACEGRTLDARADIWSFGIMLYEMLAGRLPFEEPNLSATLLAILGKPVPDITQFRPEVPESLANLIYQMLKKERDERIGSVRIVGAKLEAIMTAVDGPAIVDPRFQTPESQPVIPPIGPRHNLPRQPTPFVGREPEIAEVVQTLNDPECRLLTLVGPGGIGKTRLSLEAAHRKVDDYVHGVRFVSLAAVTSREHLIPSIAETLGLTYLNESDPRSQVINYLREKQMLLVLDNFEHLVSEAELASELLAAAPQLQILVTSREALNLWEEWIRPVRGMRYPEDTTVADIEPYSAVKLFISRAKRVLGRFDMEAELPHIIRICQLVDGMPLGIELAATWLRVLTPEQIATEIEASYDFLATGMRNIAERHRSIRAVFDYSWQLLGPEEQAVFRKLAVFQGGFTRGAAAKVTGASLLTLTNLVNKSLLYEGETHYTDTPVSGETGRYAIHELLKQYATEKLAENEAERAQVTGLHAGYFINLLRQQEARFHRAHQKQALETISDDLDNVRVAWRWAVEHTGQRPEAPGYLTAGSESLFLFYETRGLMLEGKQMFGKAVAALRALLSHALEQGEAMRSRLALGRALSAYGLFLYRMNRRPQAAEMLAEAVELLSDLLTEDQLDEEQRRDASRALVLALIYRSDSTSRSDSPEVTRRLLEEAVEISSRLGDLIHQARATNALAIHAVGYAEQAGHYRRALALSREAGDQIVATRILQNLGTMTNDPQESLVYADQIFQIYEDIGNPSGLVMGHFQSALAAWRLGQLERARQNLERSMEISREYGLREELANSLHALAQIAWAMGDVEQTEDCYDTLIRMSQEEGDPVTMIRYRQALGAFLTERSETERARKLYRDSVCLLPQVTRPREQAEALDALGNFALDVGKYDLARKHFTAALPLFEASSAPGGMAWALFNLAAIEFELGDFEKAQRLYRESLELHRTQGEPWNIARALDGLGRVAVALQQDALAQGYFRAGLQTLQSVWGVSQEIEIIVDWVPLMMRAGDKVHALETLYVLTRQPVCAPGVVVRRTRKKAARLLEELEAYLPADEVAAAATRAEARTQADLVRELLAEGAAESTGAAASA